MRNWIGLLGGGAILGLSALGAAAWRRAPAEPVVAVATGAALALLAAFALGALAGGAGEVDPRRRPSGTARGEGDASGPEVH